MLARRGVPPMHAPPVDVPRVLPRRYVPSAATTQVPTHIPCLRRHDTQVMVEELDDALPPTMDHIADSEARAHVCLGT